MSFMQLASGRPFHFSGIVDAISIEDVADQLSKINRFAGATRVPYSVAQHSDHVSKIVKARGGPKIAQLAGLLHDVHEMVTGDIITPVKLQLKGVAAFEDAMQTRICHGLNVASVMALLNLSIVRQADMVALATERRDLLVESQKPWEIELPEPDPRVIKPVGWKSARSAFIKRFHMLTKESTR